MGGGWEAQKSCMPPSHIKPRAVTYEGLLPTPMALHVSHEERWALFGKVQSISKSRSASEKPNQRYMPQPYPTTRAVDLPVKGHPRACMSVTMNDPATFSALNDAQCLCHPFTDRAMLRKLKVHQEAFAPKHYAHRRV
jgi:hypothetical protein